MKSKQAVYPLFLVIIIDSMGFGFLFPVLTPLFLKGHSAMVASISSPSTVHLLYGLVVAVYPLCMFFGAPLLGDLSDKLGRKRILYICLFGTALGYIISGIGVNVGSLSLLFAGRILDGFTAATIPMAQAAIADVSADEKSLAKTMGLMVFALAGGQVLGPLIAGVFSSSALSASFSNMLPFYVAGGVACVNILWLMVSFKETYEVTPGPVSLMKTLGSYKHIIDNKALFLITGIFLCMQLDWSFFSQATPAYLQSAFGFGHFDLGLFSGGLGLFIGIGSVFITPRLGGVLGTQRAAMVGMLLLGLGTWAAIIAQTQWVFWVATFFTTIGAAAAYAFIVTLFSGLVDESRQGWVMGITGAVIALAWMVTAALTGWLLSFGPSLAHYLAGAIGILGLLLLFVFRLVKKTQI